MRSIEDVEKLIAEKGVKIRFPRKKHYIGVGVLLHNDGIAVDVGESLCSATFPTVFCIERERAGLSLKEFQEFCRELEVVNGFKVVDGDEAVYIIPKRPKVFTFKVSYVEYELLKWVAESCKMNYTDFVRARVVREAVRTFMEGKEQRRKMKESGIV